MKTLPQKLLLGLATLALLAASLGLSDGDRALTRKVNEYEGQHRVAKVNEYEGQHRVAKVNEYEGQHRVAKVNEYEGQHRVAKVNEYEGQHRVAGDPSQWG